MPGFDGTGPTGAGPGTGGGRGYCRIARRRPGRFVSRPAGIYPFALRTGTGTGLRRGRREGLRGEERPQV